MFNKRKFHLNIPALLFLLFLFAFAGAGCKKQTVVEADFAALKIVGFVYDGQTVVTNFSGKELSVYKGARNITGGLTTPEYFSNYIRRFPQPLWLHAFPDTMPGSKPVMIMNLDLEKGQTYSLYVTGPKNDLDTFLIRDDYQPYNTKDSVAAVKFVNMMKGETISVNLGGKAYGSLVAGIPYKSESAYVQIPISRNEASFILEYRDATTGDLIFKQTVFPINSAGTDWLFKVRTMALAGIRGATGSNAPRTIGFRSF